MSVEWPTETDRWFVYVIRCSDGSLYCGMSTDPGRRFYEHSYTSRGAKYTRSRRPLTFMCEWRCDGQSEALKMEARFKKLKKAQKLQVLKSGRPP